MTRQEQQEKFFRAIGYVGDDLIQRWPRAAFW